jgi:hypothetical protein
LQDAYTSSDMLADSKKLNIEPYESAFQFPASFLTSPTIASLTSGHQSHFGSHALLLVASISLLTCAISIPRTLQLTANSSTKPSSPAISPPRSAGMKSTKSSPRPPKPSKI